MYTNINGLKIHYLIEGSGIPCVIPSLAGTRIYERTFSANLRRHLKLVFVELRSNRSDVGDIGSTTLDSVVDDIERLRAELKLERIAILGHSGHGFLPLRFATRYPERISHAILVGAVPEFHTARLTAEWGKYWEIVASKERKDLLARNLVCVKPVLSRATADEAIALNYAANGPLFFYDAHFDCTGLWEGHANNAELYRRFWDPGGEFSRFDLEVEFPKVKCPVLIASGVFDFGTIPTAWHGVKDKLANHEYRVFEKSGHYPQMEEQRLFDETLVEWLKRN
jgi:proline iminopeptidase